MKVSQMTLLLSKKSLVVDSTGTGGVIFNLPLYQRSVYTNNHVSNPGYPKLSQITTKKQESGEYTFGIKITEVHLDWMEIREPEM